MEDPVYLSDEHVLSRMLASETRQELPGSYFETRLQRDFNERDRRELAKWMGDVCLAAESQPDVFPLMALLLASKLRQTKQIPAQDIIFYTKEGITLEELKTWELYVLTTLRWDLALITPVDFLDILMQRMKLDDEKLFSDIEEAAQKMIAECSLEFKYSLYRPSMIAWACLVRATEEAGLPLVNGGLYFVSESSLH